MYRNPSLHLHLLKLPKELRDRTLVIHLRCINRHVGQAEKLKWVIGLGRGWLGRQAFRMLMEVVSLNSIEHADSFITAGGPSSLLAGHFNTDSDGHFASPFAFVKSLYLAFNFANVDFTVTRPFLALFGPSLPLFESLEVFTFEISEYDFNKSFRYVTGFCTYPVSLKAIRIISSSIKVCQLAITFIL